MTSFIVMIVFALLGILAHLTGYFLNSFAFKIFSFGCLLIAFFAFAIYITSVKNK